MVARLALDPKGLIERLPGDVGALLPGLEDRGDDLRTHEGLAARRDGSLARVSIRSDARSVALALEHARRAEDRLEEAEVLMASLQEWWHGPTTVAMRGSSTARSSCAR